MIIGQWLDTQALANNSVANFKRDYLLKYYDYDGYILMADIIIKAGGAQANDKWQACIQKDPTNYALMTCAELSSGNAILDTTNAVYSTFTATVDGTFKSSYLDKGDRTYTALTKDSANPSPWTDFPCNVSTKPNYKDGTLQCWGHKLVGSDTDGYIWTIWQWQKRLGSSQVSSGFRHLKEDKMAVIAGNYDDSAATAEKWKLRAGYVTLKNASALCASAALAIGALT